MDNLMFIMWIRSTSDFQRSNAKYLRWEE